MERFNPTQPLGQIPVCSTMEEVNSALETIFDALQRNGIAPRPVNANVAAQQDVDGNRKYPLSNPPRNWFGFKLTDVFSTGSAPAVVLDAGGTALSPGEPVTVVDVLGAYSAAVANDMGYAMVAESTTPGLMQNQIWVMPEVGVPTGTDNYTVKIDATDTPEYLPAKFRDLYTEAGIPDYNAGTHQLVYFKVVGSDPDALFAYTDLGVGGSDSDELVATDSADTPGYLEDKFIDLTMTAFNSTAHVLTHFVKVGDPGTTTLEGYVAKADFDGTVRVSAADSLAYLGTQFGYAGTEPGTGSTPVYVDATNGTTCDPFITWKDTGTYSDPATQTLVYASANVADAGFSKARLFFTPDGKCRVNAGDTLDYLEDQFTNETATAYNATLHQPVYSVTDTGKITLYTDIGATDGKIKVNSSDTLDYLEDQLTNETVTAYNASIHQPVYSVTAAGKIQFYTAIDTNDKVKVNVSDTAAYLEDQFENGDTYNDEIDLLVNHETINDGGDRKLQLFSRSALLLGIANGDITAAVDTGLTIEPGSGSITAYVYSSGEFGSTSYEESAGEAIGVENWAQYEIAGGTPVLAGRNAVGSPFMWPLALPLMYGVTTGEIPAATGNSSAITAGEGSVQGYGFNGTIWQPSGSPFTAFNNYFDIIPTGTPVFYTDVLGQRTIVNAGCAAVSS